MLTSRAQERLVDEIIRTSFESISLKDLGQDILPLLDQLLDTSGSLFYRCDENGQMMSIAGSFFEVGHEYRDHYISLDPIQTGLRRVNPRILRVATLPEWEAYIKGPVYNDFTHPNQIDDFFHMILQGDKFHGPEMIGIMLARTNNQSEFTERDGLLLAQIFPALEALIQRSTRFEKHLETLPCLETMLELNHPYAIVFNPMGKVFWASKQVSQLLNLKRKDKIGFLDNLIEAARRLGKLVQNETSSTLPFTSVVIPQEGGPPINAELRLIRTRSGEPFIFAELDSPVLSPSLKETATRFQLTAAEAEVLRLIALGLADREIAQYLFVTISTVRTHVGRILAKMGVRSRVQAALLVHGVNTCVDYQDRLD